MSFAAKTHVETAHFRQTKESKTYRNNKLRSATIGTVGGHKKIYAAVRSMITKKNDNREISTEFDEKLNK